MSDGVRKTAAHHCPTVFLLRQLTRFAFCRKFLSATHWRHLFVAASQAGVPMRARFLRGIHRPATHIHRRVPSKSIIAAVSSSPV
jgi:hypothetical protein